MAEKIAGKSDTEKKINFSVLKKHDPEIERIIDTASSVAHYTFNASSGVWEKTEVEGTLFLYSRKVSPSVIIFIMNRLNKENTRLVLSPDMEIKVQEPFLLCKLGNNEIIGIWFFDTWECQRFGALLTRFSSLSKNEKSLRIAVMMEEQKQPESPSKEEIARDPPQNNGILGMFSKAQQEYENKQKQSQKKQQQKQHPQKNGRRGSMDANTTPKQKFDTQSKKSPSINRGDEFQRKQDAFKEKHKKEQDVLLNLIGGGDNRRSSRTRAVSTSEEAELAGSQYEAIRSFSSQAGDLAIMNKLGVISEQHSNRNDLRLEPTKVIGCEELEFELRNRNKSDDNIAENSSRNPVSFEENVIRLAKSSPNLRRQNFPLTHTGTTDYNHFNSNQPTTPVIAGTQSRIATSMMVTAAASVPAPEPVSLISPNVMSRSAGVGKGRGGIINALVNSQKVSLAANFNQAGQGNKIAKKLFSEDGKKSNIPKPPSSSVLNSLMSPAAFQLASSSNISIDDVITPAEQPVVDSLTKEQFKQALLYVIQTNDDFVTTLHNAYLDVSQER